MAPYIFLSVSSEKQSSILLEKEIKKKYLESNVKKIIIISFIPPSFNCLIKN